jgi:hypothetical protein
MLDLKVGGPPCQQAQDSLALLGGRAEQRMVGTAPAPTHRWVKGTQQGVRQRADHQLDFEALLGEAGVIIVLGSRARGRRTARTTNGLEDRSLAPIAWSDQAVDSWQGMPDKVLKSTKALERHAPNLHRRATVVLASVESSVLIHAFAVRIPTEPGPRMSTPARGTPATPVPDTFIFRDLNLRPPGPQPRLQAGAKFGRLAPSQAPNRNSSEDRGRTDERLRASDDT